MKQKQAKKQTKAVRNKKNCKLFLKNKKEMKKQFAETQSESKGNNPPLNAQLTYYIYNVSYLF